MATTKTAIVFIDGNNFYHNTKESGLDPRNIDFKKLRDSICQHYGLTHKKTRYYNSIPDLRDGQITYYNHMAFLSGLEKIPDVEVITRKLQRTSTVDLQNEKKRKLSALNLCRVCNPLVEASCMDCVGNIRKKEKGIDVHIAVDMIKFSIINKECDCCILVSGDGDFVPSLDLIKSLGKEVKTAALYNGYSITLRQRYPYFTLSNSFLKQNCFK